MAIRTNQKKAIAALLANKNNKEAAEAAGVGERTLARWIAEDAEFQQALHDAEDQLVGQAVLKLLGLTGLAIGTLEDIARHGRKEAARSLAADRLLNHSYKFTELRTLAERVAALEAHFYDAE